jgi:hypothetical protein
MLSRLGNNHPNRKKHTQNVPTLPSKSKFKKKQRIYGEAGQTEEQRNRSFKLQAMPRRETQDIVKRGQRVSCTDKPLPNEKKRTEIAQHNWNRNTARNATKQGLIMRMISWPGPLMGTGLARRACRPIKR